MADAAAAGNVKTVSVSVSNDELQKLSRTRRRRQTKTALRADLTMVDNGVQEPVSNTNAIHIIKNQEFSNLAEGERKMLGNSEKPKESTIHIGLKKEATAPAPAAAAAANAANAANAAGTTAPIVSTAASAAKVTPHINPTKTPRILYTKKQPRAVAAVAKSKPAVVIPVAGTTVAATAAAAGTTVAAANAPPKKSFFGSKARTRKFKERKVSISLKRRPSNRKAIAQVATMPLTDVRAKLMAAGLLSKTSNAKKTQPPAVLRGMLTEWMQLHSGAV